MVCIFVLHVVLATSQSIYQMHDFSRCPGKEEQTFDLSLSCSMDLDIFQA